MSPHGDEVSGSIGRRGALAQAVAQAVDARPGIRRSENRVFATLYPGGHVDGVVLDRSVVTVHIDLLADQLGAPLPQIGDDLQRSIRSLLAQLGDERRVVVSIDDIVVENPEQ